MLMSNAHQRSGWLSATVRAPTHYQGGRARGARICSVPKFDPEKGAPMTRRRLYGLAVSVVGIASLYLVPVASAHGTWC